MWLHYWIEAFKLGRSRLCVDNRTISRFEARLSTKPQKTTYRSDYDWKWPGEQVGTAELLLADGDDVPSAVHVLAHYHDNYFDHISLYTNLEEAQAKFMDFQQKDLDNVKNFNIWEDGCGMVKLSKYHCALVCIWDGLWNEPDKGSTWMLLPDVLLES